MANGHGGRRQGAGRPKGKASKYNAKTREELWDYCDSQGTSPFVVMVELLNAADPRLRLDAAKALAPYLAAQLSRQEMELGDQTRRVIEKRYGPRTHNGTAV